MSDQLNWNVHDLGNEPPREELERYTKATFIKGRWNLVHREKQLSFIIESAQPFTLEYQDITEFDALKIE